ncbi:MAG: tetratricopeptide repeat protein [Ramlibacter sp.]
MKPDLDALKRKFKHGRHSEAIAGCEALSLREPANGEIRKQCALMHALMQNYSRSLELLHQVRAADQDDADVLFNIAVCERELGNTQAAAHYFNIHTEKFPGHPDGWAGLAECQKVIGQFDNALASFTQAIDLAPGDSELRVLRGDTFDLKGNIELAAADYRAALALAPTDGQTLKKATLCLLHLDRGEEAIELCREILRVHPDSLTARLGAEWLMSQLVPLWHIPMMNEHERNLPYYQALSAVVSPEKTVFEIGTGSGLLAMMAARFGARKVVTCEAVHLVADTARKIVEDNGYQDRIQVLAKPSYAVQIGKDLQAKADILVHEIFSSELLGEHVLPAIEDAKARLLKPGGEILPASASIMIALVSGDELGKEIHVGEAFGFDLRAFNAIHPRKRPIHREDLPRILLSDDVEAFRFDFRGHSTFAPEKKRIGIAVVKGGFCYGLIQWIRFEFGPGVFFENHPSRRRPVASWQHTIYRFDEPVHLDEGSVVAVDAMHDRSKPWFELAPALFEQPTLRVSTGHPVLP